MRNSYQLLVIEVLIEENDVRVAVIYPEVLDMARYRELRKEFPPFGALYIAASAEAAVCVPPRCL